LSKCRCMK